MSADAMSTVLSVAANLVRSQGIAAEDPDRMDQILRTEAMRLKRVVDETRGQA